MPYARHVYHIYALRASDRDGLQEGLRLKGIQTGVHYPIPVHLQKAYAELGYQTSDYPHSEQAAAETLSLPMYAELSDAQVRTAVAALNQWFSVAAEHG
jgi:dTDP-4-amino-4,6-dideoxygalactose transaminase